MTAAMVKASPPAPWRLQLPDSTSALRQRADFERYLRAHGGANDDYAGAELIFGELVANVMLHSPGPIDIVVEWPDGQATMHVTDSGPPIDIDARMPDPLADHGRGMPIVRKIARNISTVAFAGDGKTVSAVLPVRQRPPNVYARRRPE